MFCLLSIELGILWQQNKQKEGKEQKDTESQTRGIEGNVVESRNVRNLYFLEILKFNISLIELIF